MRFLHVSDLHFGKSLHGVSMIEQKDQNAWVDRFIEVCKELKPQAVLMAGDIYDRSSPLGSAVRLFDHLLTELAALDIAVMIVSGNHDSAEKLSFAGEILSRQKIHIAGLLEKELTRIRLEDQYGPVNFWLMPYMFPSQVSQCLEDEAIRDYNTAAQKLIERQKIDTKERNVLVAHQNVVANGVEAERGGSESMVGGVGQIEYTTFDCFDYVALGHIHAAYAVGRREVRYAGSPLYYHFDELRQKVKGPLLVEIGEKGKEISIEPIVIPPLHPLREIKDSWENVQEIMEKGEERGEYLRIVLTDTKITGQISSYLHSMAESRDSILMELISEYKEYRPVGEISHSTEIADHSIEELFEDFYTQRMVESNPTSGESQVISQAGEITREALASGKVKPDQEDIDKLLKFVLGQEG